MKSTGSGAIEHAVELTNRWIRDLMEDLEWDDRMKTHRLLRVTLQALRDRLAVDKAAALAAQLPTLLRGYYYEGWNPASAPLRDFGKAEFLARIVKAFPRERDPIEDPDGCVGKVFRLLNRRISTEEIHLLRASLPEDLRRLWPA